MVKIIETNLYLDTHGNVSDHQARVIEVESWMDYVTEINNKKTVIRDSIIGSMSGCSIPKMAIVFNLISDDNHLSCEIYNYKMIETKKFAYLIKEAI